MRNRKFYPPAKLDRALLWLGFVFIVLGITALRLMIPFAWSDWPWFAIPFAVWWLYLYIDQESPYMEMEEYVRVTADMDYLANKLGEIGEFLKHEHDKFRQSQAALEQLQNEQTALEPVIRADRDTVNAILAAHARNTTSRIWKERAIGFISGLIASLIASVIFRTFVS